MRSSPRPPPRAATDWATVTGYAEGGSDNNHPATWGADCIDGPQDPGDTYVLDQDWDLVIVKAGSEESAPGHVNTLFANATAGQTVWADSNGDGTFDQGDKGISHIIFCGPVDEETSTPTVDAHGHPDGDADGHPTARPTPGTPGCGPPTGEVLPHRTPTTPCRPRHAGGCPACRPAA